MDSATTADFSEFAHSRWPQLVRLGYGLTGDRGLAEDLAQTALASAYASWSRVRRADDPDAYLRKILLNAYQSGHRKRRPAEELRPVAPDVAVADSVGRHDDQAAVLAALAELPPRQRAVVLLRFWLDLTEAQVAQSLGCSIGTVKSQTAAGPGQAQSQRRTGGLEDQVSIDEGELRSSLSTALDEVDYGPLPLNSVISQGKTVVRRRRLTALAGALAVVVVAVAGPVIAHHAWPVRLSRSRRRTTTSPSTRPAPSQETG